VIESSFRQQNIGLVWNVPSELPLVTADNHSLLQVFLNLTRNAAKALEAVNGKRLEITTYVSDGFV
jgi:two-component system, LuxR family, sensor kinase FixL